MTDTAAHIVIGVISALGSIVASAGFWGFLNTRRDKRELDRQLLIGLAHDRIVTLCLVYIARGYITHDEYENLVMFLYSPYVKMGNNGSVTKLLEEVKKLPFHATQKARLIGEKRDVSK